VHKKGDGGGCNRDRSLRTLGKKTHSQGNRSSAGGAEAQQGEFQTVLSQLLRPISRSRVRSRIRCAHRIEGIRKNKE